MRFLLDTHTFLWWVTRHPRLSQRVRSVFEDETTQIFFSAVVAWEIAIKVRLGQLEFQGDPAREIPNQVAANGFLTLPIEVRHALQVGALPLLHRDPFDRLLVAQALLENLVVLTSDPAIARYGVQVAW